jgi:chaperonin GroES
LLHLGAGVPEGGTGTDEPVGIVHVTNLNKVGLEILWGRPYYPWHSLGESANKLSGDRVQFLLFDSILEESMKIRPLHDRVIVKRMEEERKTASGIVIPDTATEKPDQGEVVAVGPGKRDDSGKLIAMDLKVGDRVLFGKYAGQTVKVDGNELLVMREEDIMGVVEK